MGFGEFGPTPTSTSTTQFPQFTGNEPVSHNQGRNSDNNGKLSQDPNNNDTLVANCVCDLDFTHLTLEDEEFLNRNLELTEIGRETNPDNNGSVADKLVALSGAAVAEILQGLELEGESQVPATPVTGTGPNPSEFLGRNDLAYTTPTLVRSLQTPPPPPLSTITQDPVILGGLGLSGFQPNPVNPPNWNFVPVNCPLLSGQGTQQSLPAFSELQTRPIPDAISPDFLPSPPQNPSIITPRIKKARKQRPHNPNEIQPITVGAYQFSPLAWAKAFMEIPQGVSKAANVLFDHLFTDHEVRTSTKSGRGSSQTLNPDKLAAIMVSVTWMSNNRHPGQNPYHFRPHQAGTLTEDEIKAVQQVSVDRRSDRNKRLKRPPKPKTILGRPRAKGRRNLRDKTALSTVTEEQFSPEEGGESPGGIQDIIGILGRNSPPRKDDDEPGCSKRSRI